VEKEPLNTWQQTRADEYGFFANVNPDVDHPRWTQKSERRIGEFFRRKTLPFNGYGDQVASLVALAHLQRGHGRAGRRLGLGGGRTSRLGGGKLVTRVLDGRLSLGGPALDDHPPGPFERGGARPRRAGERTVRSSFAVAGITLLALPACSAPTVTTAACSGSTLRETMVCSAMTMLAAATIGSAARCGIAPWPPMPCSVIVA